MAHLAHLSILSYYVLIRDVATTAIFSALHSVYYCTSCYVCSLATIKYKRLTLIYIYIHKCVHTYIYGQKYFFVALKLFFFFHFFLCHINIVLHEYNVILKQTKSVIVHHFHQGARKLWRFEVGNFKKILKNFLDLKKNAKYL